MIKKLLKIVAARWPFPVLATLKSGRKMYVDLRSGVGQGIYVTGEFDPVVFDAISSRLTSGGVFVDVGANVGYYTFCSLDLVGDTGQVHAFEIDPRPLKCLRKTVDSLKIKNVHIHNVAVSSSKGVGFLTQESDCGHSHVDPDGSGKRVDTISLDLWQEDASCDSIDVIKIDVEGGEFSVLRGAVETLKKHKPLIVFEADNDLQDRHECRVSDITELLGSIGYEVQKVEGCWSPTMVATTV